MPGRVACKRIRHEFRSGSAPEVDERAARRNGRAHAAGFDHHALQPVAAFKADDSAFDTAHGVGSLRRCQVDHGDVFGKRLQLLGFLPAPVGGAGDHDRLPGVERAIAGGAMRQAAAFVLFFAGDAETPLVETACDHHHPANVPLAFGRLDAPRRAS